MKIPMERLAILFILTLLETASETADCPTTAFLQRSYTIMADFGGREYAGIAWTRPIDGNFMVTCNPIVDCSGTDGYSAVANSSHSRLTIRSVKLADIGVWKLTDALNTNNHTDVCTLNAAAIPGCAVTADTNDTNGLVIGDPLNLTVNITGYLCTGQHSFTITTGAETKVLLTGSSGSSLMNHTSLLNFSVTQSRFGDVRVNFTCVNSLTELKCAGVDRLLELPTCTITSDQDTDNLEIGDELSLQLTASGYFCNGDHRVDLSTGTVTQELVAGDSESTPLNLTSSMMFNVTQSHFGDVTLNFNCENRTLNRPCEGVKELLEKVQTVPPSSKQTSEIPTTQPVRTDETVSAGTTSAVSTDTTTTEHATPTTGIVEEAPCDTPNLALILGITISIMVVLIIVGIVVIKCRRRFTKAYKKYVLKHDYSHRKQGNFRKELDTIS